MTDGKKHLSVGRIYEAGQVRKVYCMLAGPVSPEHQPVVQKQAQIATAAERDNKRPARNKPNPLVQRAYFRAVNRVERHQAPIGLTRKPVIRKGIGNAVVGLLRVRLGQATNAQEKQANCRKSSFNA